MFRRQGSATIPEPQSASGRDGDATPEVEIREVVRIERHDEDIKNERILRSLNRSQGVIEFEPDGTIIGANQGFLDVVGYSLGELKGRHHRMLMFPEDAEAAAYTQFWEDLRDGHFQSAEFRRCGRGNREVWIQASYNPVFDDDGNVLMVIKFATDITRQKLAEREIQDRSVAVIEFEPDGTIVTANQLFLGATGYTLDQIRGQHHRMFMPDGEGATAAYRQFWKELGQGEFKQGQFHRVDAAGDDLWLQGSYNPVFDSHGKVIKVIKSVANTTEEVKTKEEAAVVGEAIAVRVGEMAAAIREISQSVTATSGLAQEAEASATNAAQKVNSLNENGAKIDEVVDVIHELSDSTNLLALNATMEAARAGDAGRGFGVVASEVKKLANQTNEATEEIRANVLAIRTDVAEVVDVIQGILDGVSDVSSNTSMVAAAVEQQSVVMADMSVTADRLLALNNGH